MMNSQAFVTVVRRLIFVQAASSRKARKMCNSTNRMDYMAFKLWRVFFFWDIVISKGNGRSVIQYTYMLCDNVRHVGFHV